MDHVSPREIQKILAVTDSMQIHRESISIPLATRAAGSLRVTANARLEIIAPASHFDAWLGQLPEQLQQLDLSSIRKVE